MILMMLLGWVGVWDLKFRHLPNTDLIKNISLLLTNLKSKSKSIQFNEFCFIQIRFSNRQSFFLELTIVKIDFIGRIQFAKKYLEFRHRVMSTIRLVHN